ILHPKRATGGPFSICVLGNIRYVKDPMRAAYAVRTLPRDLNVRVVQAGLTLEKRYEDATARESAKNPRYNFRGALSRAAARRLLARSDVLVQSSRMEGGANAICEAIAASVPIIASRIPGNVGTLGEGYPGLYQVGSTDALAALLYRAATSPAYYANLETACAALKPLVREARERQSWQRLLCGTRIGREPLGKR
ncbi:MAG: glycosyltransferase, partial [Candidatus Eremiobacteraeota bacterium]|nr:glycosyltransferase [Candidatus Eremiobacteraeota bacterium]